MHSQFNIISAETMREVQKNPAAYQEMLVRVAGYGSEERGDGSIYNLLYIWTV